MSNYILFLHQDLDRPRPSSPDEAMAMFKAYRDWADKMRAEGRHKGGEKLTDDAGRVLRPNGKSASVTDGPYAESKEVVGGFFVISAKNYDEACAIAQTCPHIQFGGRIEVRQIDQI